MREDQPKLGQLITGTAFRDAVHVAVTPVTVTCRLDPGDPVALVDGTTDQVEFDFDNPVGVIDPFLKHSLRVGDRCWLLLFPGEITGLRHVWTHPAFRAKLPRP